MGSHEMAKDALQECLIQIINNIDKYNEMGRFKSWVGTVSSSKCLDLLRKEKRHKYGDLDKVAEPWSPAEGSLNLEYEDVMKFINQIPDRYRTVINLFLIEGYSHREIAERLNITESSSRSLVARARKMIKESFREVQAVEDKVLREKTFKPDFRKLRII